MVRRIAEIEVSKMLVGKFNEALKEYDDDFLYGVYQEYQVLEETGVLPENCRYVRELQRLRQEMYHDNSIDIIKKDVYAEIARRWSEYRVKNTGSILEK